VLGGERSKEKEEEEEDVAVPKIACGLTFQSNSML
jgi:hypothetical protein